MCRNEPCHDEYSLLNIQYEHNAYSEYSEYNEYRHLNIQYEPVSWCGQLINVVEATYELKLNSTYWNISSQAADVGLSIFEYRWVSLFFRYTNTQAVHNLRYVTLLLFSWEWRTRRWRAAIRSHVKKYWIKIKNKTLTGSNQVTCKEVLNKDQEQDVDRQQSGHM